MTPVVLLVLLIVLAVAAIWAAERMAIPYPVALVVAGGLAGGVPGLLPGMPTVPFPPGLVLEIVLPPVLWAGALRISWRDVARHLPAISVLAVVLVIATTAAVGFAVRALVPGMPWAVAFALGAIVSPPDAAAPGAVFSRMAAPPPLAVTLQGESLLNDATGLLLYRFAVATVLTGTFSLPDAAVQFGWVAIGGAAIGAALAWLALQLATRLPDEQVQTLFMLVLPFGLYAAGEAAHTSGVLAVVVGGLLASRDASRRHSSEARLLSRGVWNVVALGMEGLLFALIGTQLPAVTAAIPAEALPRLMATGAALAGVVIVVRVVTVFPAALLTDWVAARRQGDAAVRRSTRPSWRLLLVSGWCGMRGIVSLAAALALPERLPGGEPLPFRAEVIFMTCVVVLLTLLPPGLTLAPLLRRLGLADDPEAASEFRMARKAAAQAAREKMAELVREGRIDASVARHLGRERKARLRAALPADDDAAQDDPFVQARTASLAAERACLLQLAKDQRISEPVLHALEREIDLAEVHLRSVAA